MFDVIFSLFKMLFSLIFFVFKASLLFLVPFALSSFVFFIFYYFKGYRFHVRKNRSTYKRTNFLKKLFFDFPQRFVLDLYAKDFDKFPIDGLHLFAGEQGSGKSMAAVEMMLRYKKMYPLSIVKSNINVNFQDGKITGWEDIVFDSNGSAGIILFIDEIQNWFNSNESKNFPPDMIQEICQLRKQIKVIIGTSQVFSRVAKPIREQVRVLYKPLTILGCLTIVRVYRPTVKQDGSLEKLRRLKTYFFVHTDELRNAYDTYEKVERLIKNGFKPVSERFKDDSEQVKIKLEK